MYKVIDGSKYIKFWAYGPKTIKNTNVSERINQSAFSCEAAELETKLRVNYSYNLALERYIYPDLVKEDKIVVSFPSLIVSMLSMRTCYETKEKFKHPKDLVIYKCTETRQVTEVFCMLYDKRPDGEFKKVFPIILWAKGFPAERLYSNYLWFNAQLNQVYPTERLYAQQFILDLTFRKKPVMVGSGKKKSSRHSGIKSKIYPLDLWPTPLSNKADLSDEQILKKELLCRKISNKEWNEQIIPLCNRSKDWRLEWAEGSDFMNKQMDDARDYFKTHPR
jgi:hypothetical protein